MKGCFVAYGFTVEDIVQLEAQKDVYEELGVKHRVCEQCITPSTIFDDWQNGLCVRCQNGERELTGLEIAPKVAVSYKLLGISARACSECKFVGRCTKKDWYRCVGCTKWLCDMCCYEPETGETFYDNTLCSTCAKK